MDPSLRRDDASRTAVGDSPHLRDEFRFGGEKPRLRRLTPVVPADEAMGQRAASVPIGAEARRMNMKTLFFAAALMLSGAAFAQDTTPSADAGGQPVAPGNANPERDARGIPVVSDPATAPAGANQAFSVPPGAQVVLQPTTQAFTTTPSTGDKPPCSRTVTDNCTQTYEHGTRRRPH
jgi:hypothetical protein